MFLWNEINSNCFDVWQWMKEKQFNQSLSNGQKQRLILAKILYWLDDSIAVIVLDECTSGLDDKNNSDSADAEKILAYIIQYANLDKNRIVIISTHQNIDGVKESLSHQYNFRNFQFIQTKTENIIQEI
ncbi:MAG: ABC transporter ATP-binding protein [Clostridia bacterium]